MRCCNSRTTWLSSVLSGSGFIKYISVFLACLAVTLAGSARAQEVPLEYYINSPLLVGHGKPKLTLITEDPLSNVKVTLKGRGKTVKRSLSAIKPEQPVEIEFDSPVGVHTWTVEMKGTWRDEPFTLSFDFEFDVTEPLKLTIPPDDIDLEAHQLTLSMSRPAGFVEYEIMRDDGAIIGQGRVDYAGQVAGTSLQLSWEQTEGVVLKILLTAYDVDSYWTKVELIPWSLEIPHEEVHFKTGSDVIDQSELHKVDDAYAKLVEAVERYGEFVQVNLYVAGYTDTVGSRADNQKLSEQRARSLAQAFRQRGFDFPIYYQGFGEDAPAVATPDNTDEIRNRRALYILAAEPPLPSTHIPHGDWRKLQ